MMKIAFIGIGVMGRSMVINLLKLTPMVQF